MHDIIYKERSFLLSEDLDVQALNGFERIADHVGLALFVDPQSHQVSFGSELEFGHLRLLVLLHEAV